MQDQQTIPQFAGYTLAFIIWSVGTALLMMDYRGILTRHAHSIWLTYQRPFYQRMFRWTGSLRAHADENRIRHIHRVVAGLGLATGVLILSLELGGLVTGHVR